MAVNGNRSGKPILDTGTTQKMFKDRSLFAKYAPLDTTIEVANGDSIEAQGVGTVKATHLGSPLSFPNALHVPDLKTDLVSMTELAKKGCSIEFSNNGSFEVIQGSDAVLSGKLADGLMELDVDIGKSPPSFTALATRTDGNLLHSRLGHPGPIPLSKGFPGITPPTSCDPCIMAKQLVYHTKENLKGLLSD